MDIEAYWQENRRFVLGVGAGLLVFLVGRAAIGRTVGKDVKAAALREQRANSKLGRLDRDGFSNTEMDEIAADNDALHARLAELRPAVHFDPRPEYRGEDGRVTAATFLAQVSAVRDELRPAAGRANVALDETFGLPEQSPTREDELARHLLALDQVHHLCAIAIDARVDAVQRLRIKLDPGLRGRGTGRVERTRVEARLIGSNLALLETLRRLQREPRLEGELPLIESFSMTALRENPDDGQLDLELVVPSVIQDSAEPETLTSP